MPDELPRDTLFERMVGIDPATGNVATLDRCKGCGEYVEPLSEAREAHLGDGHCPAWEAHCRGERVEGWNA